MYEWDLPSARGVLLLHFIVGMNTAVERAWGVQEVFEGRPGTQPEQGLRRFIDLHTRYATRSRRLPGGELLEQVIPRKVARGRVARSQRDRQECRTHSCELRESPAHPIKWSCTISVCSEWSAHPCGRAFRGGGHSHASLNPHSNSAGLWQLEPEQKLGRRGSDGQPGRARGSCTPAPDGVSPFVIAQSLSRSCRPRTLPAWLSR